MLRVIRAVAGLAAVQNGPVSHAAGTGFLDFAIKKCNGFLANVLQNIAVGVML